jgi:amino acid adenylation domain-containing protein
MNDPIAFPAPTIVGQLRAHVAAGCTAGYEFACDGQAAVQQLGFAELDARSEVLAAELAAGGFAGRHALLLFPSSLEFIVAFFACLKAGVVAIPMPEPRKEAQWQRLRVVHRTVPVALVLAPDLHQAEELRRELAIEQVLAVDMARLAAAARPAPLALPHPGACAFLQFTSGSTGAPKGVRVTHANIMANQFRIAEAFGSGPGSVGVGWLPMFHDMGLIGNVLHPVFAGFSITLLAPAAVVRRPAFWLETIARTGATFSGGPSFMYRLCVERADARRLDLSRWRVAFCGAERVDAGTAHRFAEQFAPAGFAPEAFFPCYGLAEATLMVSGGPAGRVAPRRALDQQALARGHAVEAAAGAHAIVLVGCGRVGSQDQVRVVDPDSGTPLECGAVGEIWVSGPSVADGYAGGGAADAAQFARRCADGSGPWLATGDYGFFDADGELYVSGRRKELIIVHGRNYYPHDLEQAACAAASELEPAGCAAFSISRSGTEQVVLVAEVRRTAMRGLAVDALGRRVRAAVAALDLALAEVMLVRVGALPRTSSGKLERGRTRALYLQGELEGLAGSTAVPAPAPSTAASPAIALAARIAGVATLDPTLPLGALGFDSLRTYQLAFALEQELGQRVEADTLMSAPSLAAALAEARPVAVPGPQAAREHALSPGQAALWLEQQQYPQRGLFTLAFPLWIAGRADLARVRSALEAVLRCHPLLRSNVAVVDGEPRWVRRGDVDTPLWIVDAADWERPRIEQAMAEVATRSLSLDADPLLQLHCWRGEGDDVLMLVAHHIVTDGWGLQQFAADFFRAFEGAPLAPAAGFGQFEAWQRGWIEGEHGVAARAFWQAHLAAPAARLSWPGADSRQPALAARRSRHRLRKGLAPALGAYAARVGVTVFEVLLSAFAVTVAAWSSERRFTVAVPMLGRSEAEFARTQGYCVQLGTLRFAVDTPDFATLCRRTAQTLRAARRHQWFPQLALSELGLDHGYQVLFTMHEFVHGLELGGVLAGTGGAVGPWTVRPLDPLPMERREELAFSVLRLDDELVLHADFLPRHVDAATVAAMAAHFEEVLCTVAATRDMPLERITRLPPQAWSVVRTEAIHADDHWLARIHARRADPSLALVAGTQALSYAELVGWAEDIAAALREHGAGPGTRVAVLLPREPVLVAALLGTLLAGAAYVPLDPNYPAARTAHVLEHARPALLLTTPDLAAGLAAGAAPRILAVPARRSVGQARHGACAAWHGDQAALVIYTSGSTGRPKGVEIRYAALATLHAWAAATFPTGAWTGVAATTSVCFDLSVYELFSTLYAGGTIHLFANAIEVGAHGPDDRLRLLNTVPSACRELLDGPGLPPRLEVLNLAGEPLPGALLAQLHARYPNLAVHNLYGPTEDTTYSTHAPLRAPAPPCIPVGRPLPGTEAWVLNSHGEPVARGTIGELYLGGVGLAQGYLHAPGLTAERFLPHPQPAHPGQRLYRTGDLARLNPQGLLEVAGRADQQVKLRGFRIETGEIAAALQRMPEVRAAAVLLREPPEVPHARLEAYVAGPDTLAPEALRAALVAELPAYMIPAEIHVLAALPLTANGKIDRLALAARVPARRRTAVPADPQEARLLAIWRRLLGRDDIGIEDDFFMAGGHSMLVMRLVREVESAFGVQLDVAAIFAYRTVASQARHLNRLDRVGALSAPPDRSAQMETIEI